MLSLKNLSLASAFICCVGGTCVGLTGVDSSPQERHLSKRREEAGRKRALQCCDEFKEVLSCLAKNTLDAHEKQTYTELMSVAENLKSKIPNGFPILDKEGKIRSLLGEIYCSYDNIGSLTSIIESHTEFIESYKGKPENEFVKILANATIEFKQEIENDKKKIGEAIIELIKLTGEDTNLEKLLTERDKYENYRYSEDRDRRFWSAPLTIQWPHCYPE
jgi:hypothetical protein